MSKKAKKDKKIVTEEIDVLDDMLSALVEVLEEKGLISQEEWERKIKEKLQRRTSLKSFREL